MRTAFAILVTILLATSVVAGDTSFVDKYKQVIASNSYSATLKWLQENRPEYERNYSFYGHDKEYMNGENLVTVAYEAKKLASLRAVAEFAPELLSKFIPSDHGCGRGEPPTIFFAVRDDSFEAVKLLLDKGANPKVLWPQVGNFNLNLYGVAVSEKMRQLLRSYGAEVYVKVNNSPATCNDSDVRVREAPGLDGKILRKVQKGKTGKIDQVTSPNFNGGGEVWYHIVFDDGTSGWSLGEFYQVPGLGDC